MPNPRFLSLAQRLRNKDAPEARSLGEQVRVESLTADTLRYSPRIGAVDSSFILEYNDFGNEVIAKANELFAGTKAEMPMNRKGLLGTKALTGEVPNMYILKRCALTTAIYHDAGLRNQRLLPITPLQSEQLLKDGKLPKPNAYWEDVGLLLYDLNTTNAAEACALHEDVKRHRSDLGLKESDLTKRLLVVWAGLEKDGAMPHGVKPVVLPGLTRVYTPDSLQQIAGGKTYKFSHGLDQGMPPVSELGTGNRTLYTPSAADNIGLRVLVRDRYLDLYARYYELAYSYASGRVNFARQGDAF